MNLEIPSWCSGNESDEEPWGCRFNPWPRSVGWGSSIAMSCGAGRRCSSDLVLLWLWRRLTTVAPIRPLAWEPPCAAGMALKKKKSEWTCTTGWEVDFHIYNYIHSPKQIMCSTFGACFFFFFPNFFCQEIGELHRVQDLNQIWPKEWSLSWALWSNKLRDFCWSS